MSASLKGRLAGWKESRVIRRGEGGRLCSECVDASRRWVRFSDFRGAVMLWASLSFGGLHLGPTNAGCKFGDGGGLGCVDRQN